jgi:hypothetical protein
MTACFMSASLHPEEAQVAHVVVARVVWLLPFRKVEVDLVGYAEILAPLGRRAYTLRRTCIIGSSAPSGPIARRRATLANLVFQCPYNKAGVDESVMKLRCLLDDLGSIRSASELVFESSTWGDGLAHSRILVSFRQPHETPV